ncbi:unnamed protein product [Acanthoscelides obtectus]|uniref:Uncharacterized protein n=1 Tax=Acanthoscelides obtectus TaxID=200917 RepID=A0A9P0MCA9_ACAOB|nr:unnamed protein product [Acanthoscelides obtectus]CAK1677625.1 hypothetical protein AOBTE_LOCUS31439 [Acanthoscelides obtectus]
MHSMSDSLFSNTTFIVRILKFQRVVAPWGIFSPQSCSVPLRVEENYKKIPEYLSNLQRTPSLGHNQLCQGNFLLTDLRRSKYVF